MNASLDKSLDEIISTNGAKRNGRNRQAGVRKSALSRKKAAVKGATASGAKAPAARAKATTKKAAATIAKATNQDLTQFATRVIISNMPKDVTENQVEKFFKSELGSVSKVVASYNAKGVRTGQFTITFTKDGLAAKAMERFNGTVIDNGAAKMKVELVFDQSAKPLASRLSLTPKKAATGPAADAALSSSQKKRLRVKKQKASAAVAAAAAAPANGTPKAKQPRRRSAKGRAPKTAAELDAEMADYFAGGEPAAAPADDVIS